MKTGYHLDLEKFSVAKLKDCLQNRDMIPSRVILKEDLQRRFSILESNGIRNLKALINILKTKSKVEAFSNKTGLSTEYLTVLKREASSYLPKPVNLNKFPEIDIKTIEALENIGIKNTKHFFNEVNVEKKSDLISENTGIPVDKLNVLASLSDLARLYGVGPVFARIIYDAGIESVERFVEYSASDFIEMYENSTGKKADFSENDINFSIDLAKKMIGSM